MAQTPATAAAPVIVAQFARSTAQQPEASHPDALVAYMFLDHCTQAKPKIEAATANLCNAVKELKQMKREVDEAVKQGDHELATEKRWKHLQEQGASEMLQRIEPYCEPKVDPTIQGYAFADSVAELVTTMAQMGAEHRKEVQTLKEAAEVVKVQEGQQKLKDVLRHFTATLARSSKDAEKVLDQEKPIPLEELEEQYGSPTLVMITGELYPQLREKLKRDAKGVVRLQEKLPGLMVPQGARLPETTIMTFDENERRVSAFDLMGQEPLPAGCVGPAFFEAEASEKKEDDDSFFHAMRSKPREDAIRLAHCMISLAAKQLAELDDSVSDSKQTPPQMMQRAAEIDRKRELVVLELKDLQKQVDAQQEGAIEHFERTQEELKALKDSKATMEGLKQECVGLICNLKDEAQHLFHLAVQKLMEAKSVEVCYHAISTASELHGKKVGVEEKNVLKLSASLDKSTKAFERVNLENERVTRDSVDTSAYLRRECKEQASQLLQLKEDTKCVVRLAIADTENELAEVEDQALKAQAKFDQSLKRMSDRSKHATCQKQLEKHRANALHQQAVLKSQLEQLPAAPEGPEVEPRVRRELYNPNPLTLTQSPSESAAACAAASPEGAIELREVSRQRQEKTEKRVQDQLHAIMEFVKNKDEAHKKEIAELKKEVEFLRLSKGVETDSEAKRDTDSEASSWDVLGLPEPEAPGQQ